MAKLSHILSGRPHLLGNFGLIIHKKQLVLGLFLALVVISYNPSRAEAGVLSFISDIFNKTSAADLPDKNSQTVALLEAAVNSDPTPPTGAGAIISGNALLPNTGPDGTVAEDEGVAPSDEISLYVVRRGDTLSSIAKMFDVSADTIRWANSLNGSPREGDTLVILPVNGVIHEVKKGDTIRSIAKKYGVDADDILSFNDLESPDLDIGQQIIIPGGRVASTPSNPRPRHSSYSAPTYIGYFMRPLLTGIRTQGAHGRLRNAVDFGASCGTPIYASASGVVRVARTFGWNHGAGKVVIISHPNGTQTMYAHQSALVASEGQSVTQGQLIGYVGSTGKSTGCHVHFEVVGAQNPFK